MEREGREIKPVKLQNDIIVNEIFLKEIFEKIETCTNINVTYYKHYVQIEYTTPYGTGGYIVHDISSIIENPDNVKYTDLLKQFD